MFNLKKREVTFALICSQSVGLLFLKQFYCYLYLHYDNTQGLSIQLIVPDTKNEKRLHSTYVNFTHVEVKCLDGPYQLGTHGANQST